MVSIDIYDKANSKRQRDSFDKRKDGIKKFIREDNAKLSKKELKSHLRKISINGCMTQEVISEIHPERKEYLQTIYGF